MRIAAIILSYLLGLQLASASTQKTFSYIWISIFPSDDSKKISEPWFQVTRPINLFVLPDQTVWLELEPNKAYVSIHPQENQPYFFDMVAGTRHLIPSTAYPSFTITKETDEKCGKLHHADVTDLEALSFCLKPGTELLPAALGQVFFGMNFKSPGEITEIRRFIKRENFPLTLLIPLPLPTPPRFLDDPVELWKYAVTPRNCADFACGHDRKMRKLTDPRYNPKKPLFL